MPNLSRWLLLSGVLGTSCVDAVESGADAALATIDARAAFDSSSAPSRLEELLDELRRDAPSAVLRQAMAEGWPAPVAGGALFVSLDPTLSRVAGDHDSWTGTAMNVESGFAWLVLDVGAGARYKFTDGDRWRADPNSRAYSYDENGLMSQTIPSGAHLERFFSIGDDKTPPRTVRVWVPAEEPTHVLYCHDGQNLFSPAAAFGGWQLVDSAREGLMVVGIDNSDARLSEYTPIADNLGSGPVGGEGSAYADFVNTSVRGLVEDRYGEAPTIGTMGSSLGGLISLHIADRFPESFDFAASLSGTLGWGSVGGSAGGTLLHRYQSAGHRQVAIYLDSGGGAESCVDSDGEGVKDDGDGSDNYCETLQMRDVLEAQGYLHGEDLWHWWEPGASHNEAAWAARVFRPLDAFLGLGPS